MVTDAILTDYDLTITDGDFLISFSDQQHIQLIIATAQGEWKEFPLLGVGSDQYINAPNNMQDFTKNIKIQLTSDNYKVNQIDVRNNHDIYIDAIRL